MLELMILPIVMGVILTGILSYLGIHIVQREVIFVDLALAQIAALGAAVGVLFGLEPHGLQAYGASLVFVLLGAALFASTKMKEQDVPREAVIGITYAVAAAASVLAFSKAPGAAEKIQDMLLGNILSASSRDVATVFVVSAAVGAFHLVFRRHFALISERPDQAQARGLCLALWDFLFYASLGLVVVSAVGVVGILLVFTYLIIPAVCAMLLRRGMGARAAMAWALGTLGTFLGVYLSVLLDLPTGATMVCTFACLLVLVAVLRVVRRRPTKGALRETAAEQSATVAGR